MSNFYTKYYVSKELCQKLS